MWIFFQVENLQKSLKSANSINESPAALQTKLQQVKELEEEVCIDENPFYV